MVAVAAGGAQVVGAEGEALVGEQALGVGVVEGSPFELDEEERRLDLGAAFLDLLHERAGGGVGGVDREAQAGVGAGAPHELLDLPELAHRALQGGAVELGQLADVLGRESLGSLQGLR